MVKQYAGYEAKASTNKPEALPAGVYVGVVKGARVEDTQWGGQRLILALDVFEGEHKDHYQKLFDWETANGSYTPKWKGTFRQNIPTGDGSEKDAWTKRSFEGNLWAIEQSNPGYKWDWNEQGLKGKMIGLNVRNKEWEYNDQTGWTTEIGRLECVEDVKSGKAKVMKDKPLNGTANAQATAPVDEQTGYATVNTSELPF
jgi:hypothetical protein